MITAKHLEQSEVRDQSIVKFSNDLFFKYMLSREHPVSSALLIHLINLITKINCCQAIVLNPAIDADHVSGKGIVLDVRIQDDKGNIFNIEMQMYGSSASQMKRMQYYVAAMITDQLNQGEHYYRLRKVYQCVFINLNNNNDTLIEKYEFKNQYHQPIASSLSSSYFIYIKQIDKILETKKVEELSDLERLCYLFKNNDYNGIIKEEDEDIIRQVITMYEKFKKDDEMWELGRLRESALNLEESHKMEYRDIGHAEGMKEGLLKGLINSCNLIIKNLYQVESISWLETLSKNQLEHIQILAFKIKDFNQLKKEIETFE